MTTTKVKIDLEAIFASNSIELTPSTSYRVAVTEGFVKEPGLVAQPQPGNANFYTFTSNPLPTIGTTNPASGATDVVNNRSMTLSYDRKMVASTGNVYVYKDGTPDTLIATYAANDTSKVTFSGSNIIVKTLGLLVAGGTYYVLTDASAIKDTDGLKQAAITSETAVRFTAATEPLFPELKANLSQSPTTLTLTPKVILAVDRYLSPADANFTWQEDTNTNILYTPKVADWAYTGAGSYSLTITPSVTAAVTTLSTTNSLGGGYAFNNTTKVFTLTGSRDQINFMLDNLQFDPAQDYNTTFTMTYRVVVPAGPNMSKTQSMICGGLIDNEVTNMPLARTFLANQANYIFSSNTPSITDFDPTANLTYSITLSSTSGGFSALTNETDYATTWTFSGTRADVNAKFSVLRFFPTKGLTGAVTINYIQLKNGVQQVSTSFTATGSANTFSTQVIYPTGAYVPSKEAVLYAVADILLVGGGGGGGYRGGGGGGAVYTITGLTLTNQTYALTTGSGGAAGGAFTNNGIVPVYGDGSSGTLTSGFGYIAGGGGPGEGFYNFQNYPAVAPTCAYYSTWRGDGGNSGAVLLQSNSSTVVAAYIGGAYSGTSCSQTNPQYGGGGAGAGGNANAATASATTNVAGIGVISDISGTSTGYGGGGGSRYGSANTVYGGGSVYNYLNGNTLIVAARAGSGGGGAGGQEDTSYGLGDRHCKPGAAGTIIVRLRAAP